MKSCAHCQYNEPDSCSRGVTVLGKQPVNFFCSMYRKKKARNRVRVPIEKQSKRELKKQCVELHSQLIRARGNYKCYFAGKIPHRCTDVMQNNHIISRQNERLLLDDTNCVCGCSGINLWAEHNEKAYHDYFRQHEPIRWAYLEKMSRLNVKMHATDYRSLLIKIKNELARI